MTNHTDTEADAEFEVIGPDLPRRSAAPKDVIANNVARARETPGVWCKIYGYKSSSAAYNARIRLAKQYPDLHWASQTIGTGTRRVPSVAAMYDPDNPPPPVTEDDTDTE